MSKKRSKSATGSAGVQRWEQALLSATLVEDKWTSTIAFIVGSQLEDYTHLETLVTAVNGGSRKLFNIVSKDELYAQVNELGNPKNKKAKEVPQNYEVCEPCKDYLDSGEDVPVALLAKLLKFKLLDIKQKDLKRRENEKKAAQDKDKPGKKGGDKKDRSKSPTKGKGGKKTPEPPSAKEGSKLRKRGDEDTDSKYIDDEPEDGTDNYIFVCGFHEPHLIGQLSELGINVDCIVKVTSEDYSRFEAKISPFDELDQPEQDEKQIAAAEEASKLREKKAKDLRHFWRDVLLLLQDVPQGSKLHDVAQLEYIVKEAIIPESMDDNEQMTKFGTDLFEDTACMLYDLLDAKRHWKNFLENLKLIQVPEFGQQPSTMPGPETQSMPPVTPAPTVAKTEKGLTTDAPVQGEVEVKHTVEVDMRYYSELMNNIPHESVSIPLVMHCILEQVVASEEDKEPPSETPRPPRADGLESSLAAHISSVAYKLALSEEEQQALSTDFEPPKKAELARKQPLLLTHRDNTSMRLSHLKAVDGFDPMQAELEMMGFYPVAELQNLPCPTPRERKDRAARLQELLHFCATGGMTQSEIDHAFKQFVLECVDLSYTDSEGNVLPLPDTPQVNIAWDDPYPYFVGMIPRVVNEDELESNTHSLDLRSGAKSPLPVDTESVGFRDSPLPSNGSPAKSDSRPSSASILKGPTDSTMSRKSASAHSVHFEKDNEGQLMAQPGDGAEQLLEEPSVVDLPTMESADDVNDIQKRNLNQWCFAEYLEAPVLLQVLKDTMYTHPYIDTYYHCRDNTLMVVLHNPHADNLQSTVNWHCALHSNVGFRNYLEYIAESVSEWTKEEEAKYQASLLASEVEKIHKEADEASSRPASAKDKKRDRSKSPKKSSSRAGKSPSRSSSTERPSSANPYVRTGSLKAWKEEQDRVKAEEEEKERMKNEKRARSAQKKASKEQVEEKKEKRPGSRSSSKSKASKEEVAPPAEQPEEPKVDERYWPFTGYDMGNDLLHAKGTISSMYPADGGQIRTEKYEFVQGTIGVKTTVHKDGHTFVVHVLDPKGQSEEPEEEEEWPGSSQPVENGHEKGDFEKSEKNEVSSSRSEGTSTDPVDTDHVEPQLPPEPEVKKPCVGRFGSFCGQLSDGMSLSLSTYGNTGEAANGKRYEPKPYTPPPPRSQSPTGKDAASPGKGKRDKGKDKSVATPEPPPQEEEPKEEVTVEVKVEEQPFQQLYVTCPDGLAINYYLESAAGVCPKNPSSKRLLIRQSYPFPTRGVQPSESRRHAAMEESSRITNSDGSVIRLLKDGTKQVLYADGGVSQFCMSTPLISSSRTTSPQRAGSAKSDRANTPTKKKERQSRSAKKKDVQEVVVEEVAVDPGYWITTTASGERVATAMDGSRVPIKDSLVCKATDPHTKQVMYTREDHTVIVHHPDSTTIVEHADGTRITTFLSELRLPADQTACDETGEVAAMETKLVKLVQVECPGFATLRFDTESSECSTEFGNGTIINTFIDGSYDLYHCDDSYLRIEEDGTTVYHPRPNSSLEVLDPSRNLNYVMRHFADVVVETVDNQGNVFNVQNTGETTVLMSDGNEIVTEEAREGHNGDGHQDAANNAHNVHTVTHYKQHAPKFFILNQDGSGTELLRYQDVSQFIADAEDDLSTAILMDPIPDHPGVLGITVMKPYTKDISQKWIKEYTQDSIMPSGLNSRDLTTLPAKEMKKDGPAFGTNVGQGLAVGSMLRSPMQPPVVKCPSALEIRQLLQFKPISDDMRKKLSNGLSEYAEYVQARLEDSEALQVQDPRSEDERMLATDLQTQMTEPERIPTPQPIPISEDVKDLYQTVTAPPVPSPPPTPQPKRSQADWDRDARERAQEEECRKALREHSVPPYFESQLGKAFLLTQAPDVEALTKQLSDDPRRDDTKAVRSDSSSPNSGVVTRMSSSVPPTDTVLRESHSSDSNLSAANPPENVESTLTVTESPAPTVAGGTGTTPSALRPGNPTPSHATGQGSPTALRPGNPTPGHATKVVPDRPDNPAPVADTPSVYPSIPEHEPSQTTPVQPTMTSYETRKAHMNVLGEPRLNPIQIPGYIRSGRPGAQPNDKFIRTEDPVRRKMYTTSITGATPAGAQILSSMRGFELLPDRVDFGTLREGSMYSFTLLLKNTGVDACRFKVKQPPPSTGMKVLFKPGPVAAGLKAELVVEIYAIAVGVEGGRGIGQIDHCLEITTETDHLTVPITATVLTAYDYDNQAANSPRTRKGQGVKHISDRSPGGQGIIRPRKDDIVGVH